MSNQETRRVEIHMVSGKCFAYNLTENARNELKQLIVDNCNVIRIGDVYYMKQNIEWIDFDF